MKVIVHNNLSQLSYESITMKAIVDTMLIHSTSVQPLLKLVILWLLQLILE